MFAELLGKEAGYCRGKGGSMHIADPATGNLGANAIVGGSAGIATGAALSSKRLGTGQVTVCFFGEGALGQGVLYEVMNLASLWKLPVVYACENNLYTEYTLIIRRRRRAISWPALQHSELEAESVDGQDVRAVYLTAKKLIDRARKAEGPAFLLCNTYRFTGHHVGDINREYYRSKQEEQEWKTGRDPIRNLAGTLIAEQLTDAATLEGIQSRSAGGDGKQQADFARRRRTQLSTKWSKTFMPEALDDVNWTFGAQAVREALAEEMRRDSRVCIFGEDVAEAGTPFKVLSGARR